MQGKDDEIGVWLRCGALEVIHETMQSHPQSSIIQQNGCHAVQLVVARLGGDAQVYACDIGFCEACVSALSGTKLAVVHEHASAALRALACYERESPDYAGEMFEDSFSNKLRIGDFGGVEALVHSLKMHSTTPEIVTHTLWALWHLCRSPAIKKITADNTTDDANDDPEAEQWKTWAAANHRRAVAVKAADAAVAAKAKFPWVDSVQDGSGGLLGVIGEVPASAALGRARARAVAQDFKPVPASGALEPVTEQEIDAANERLLEAMMDLPPPTLRSSSAMGAPDSEQQAEKARGDAASAEYEGSLFALSSELYQTGSIGDPIIGAIGEQIMGTINPVTGAPKRAAVVEADRIRDHSKTTSILEHEEALTKDKEWSNAELAKVKEMQPTPYILIEHKRRTNAEKKEKMKAWLAEERKTIMTAYMLKEGLTSDEAEARAKQAKKIQNAARKKAARKAKATGQKPSKKDKADLKKKKAAAKKAEQAMLAERALKAEDAKEAYRKQTRSKWRAAGLRVGKRESAKQTVDGMKVEHAKMAQEDAGTNSVSFCLASFCRFLDSVSGGVLFRCGAGGRAVEACGRTGADGCRDQQQPRLLSI